MSDSATLRAQMTCRHRSAVAPLVALAILALAGCGGGKPVTPSRLDQALATAGTGGPPRGAGFGWIDVERLREIGRPGLALTASHLAGALGAGAEELVDRSRTLRRAIGLDPLAARELVSVTGSFVFGVRIDRADGRRLQRLVGGTRVRTGGWSLVNVGPEGQIPDLFLRIPVDSLGARLAVGSHRVVLARTDDARAGLIGAGNSFAADPGFAFVGHCLGDVVAARIVPSIFVQPVDSGIDLLGIGDRARPASRSGRPQEVLCALAESSADADREAAALASSLAPTAGDPTGGGQLGDVLVDSEVGRLDAGDLHAARAVVTLRSPRRVGFLFDAVAAGGLFGHLGSRVPISRPASRRSLR